MRPIVIAVLHDAGVRIVMLTVDNWVTAEAVARKLGIDEVEAEVLPDRKSEIVTRLRKEERVVAMAGDGVNDAPALAAADVGIAGCGNRFSRTTRAALPIGDQPMTRSSYIVPIKSARPRRGRPASITTRRRRARKPITFDGRSKFCSSFEMAKNTEPDPKRGASRFKQKNVKAGLSRRHAQRSSRSETATPP